MKRVFAILAAVLLTASLFAQSPQKMSYQAVIRNGDSKLVTTQVGMQITILQGSESGTAVYVETQTPTPNINGLVMIEIGSGTLVSGNFSTINWANGPYFIKTETAVVAPLTTYTIVGTSQLLSVPYALHSKISENATELESQIGIMQNTLIINGLLVKDIDGNVYGIVRIGFQYWMAENLKTTKFNDGTQIPLKTDDTQWSNLISPGYCWYNNNEASYKNPYGALYNWYTVNTGNLCPKGWHVPTDVEWHTLASFLDANALLSNPESLTAGGKLKEMGTMHWISPNTGATNETDFTALPGGTRNYNGDGAFKYIGNIGTWWSATENDAANAWGRGLHWDNTIMYRGDTSGKSRGYSVRCVRD